MKENTKKIIAFIRNNPTIIYSLILIFFIPVAIFFNTYFIINRFQKNIDSLMHAKAALAENIISIAAQSILDDPQSLSDMTSRIIRENSEIKELDIMRPTEDKDNFKIITSNNPDLIGKTLEGSKKTQGVLAWSNPEGIALMEDNGKERMWNVAKYITNSSNEKVALVSMSFSLLESDRLINSTVNISYIILLATVSIVILLVSNHARLFSYAVSLEKLKEVDEMKDTFISMASHELRAPLTAVSGYLELFQDQNKETIKKETYSYLKNINISIARLNTLVDDILDVSRIEGGRLPIEMTPTDAEKIIIESMEEMRAQAIQKNLSLNYLPSHSRKIMANPERLKQIMINLISNAIKYTPQGKVEITTKIDAKKGELLIIVADSGMGIPAEEQKNLFQKFYRVKSDETSSIIGTGLGLWITRELAKKMNGDITLESIYGVGSHFTVHMKLA